MKILGIDTSTKFLSLGIYNDGKVYEYNLEVGHKLSSLLTLLIKRAINAAALEVGDFDYFACGLGPGSFTGIRVGLSAIKGLSWATGKPVIGISTLDIMALNAESKAKIICPVIDAKRNLIYSCFYKFVSGKLKKITPYMLLSKEELCKKLKPQSAVFGDALNLYKEEILKETPGLTMLDKDQWYPLPHNIIKIALGRIKDKLLDDPVKINPIYLYPKDCQVSK
ncbi:MAG: tRNA (adenosine(37)-N6)-threonylcarbamoyltransferase complex dimerization subunit type 1 TsaB [Candidatus Omnitrophica bacterium]|nr:tRNA (adenosine(37)-N6)-threonylcarbamoyltransferase complex dimerization subunit type 1 TsaB [Candidatus Omnitrophota bacterium]